MTRWMICHLEPFGYTLRVDFVRDLDQTEPQSIFTSVEILGSRIYPVALLLRAREIHFFFHPPA